jgi:hypothetical protein
MSTTIENFAVLHYNPFVLSPLFESFYKNVTIQPNNILLAYLVLPLTLHSTSREFLKKARSTSSLRTFCSQRERLHGLPTRVQDCRALTQLCLQLAFDAGGIRSEDDLSIHFISSVLDSSICPIDTVHAAERLGKIFADLEIPAIYRFLGVKKL